MQSAHFYFVTAGKSIATVCILLVMLIPATIIYALLGIGMTAEERFYNDNMIATIVAYPITIGIAAAFTHSISIEKLHYSKNLVEYTILGLLIILSILSIAALFLGESLGKNTSVIANAIGFNLTTVAYWYVRNR